MKISTVGPALLAGMFLVTGSLSAVDQMAVVEKSKSMVPTPPWPAGDQKGMANTLGAGTWLRCAAHMSAPGAKSYELSHERSNTMPLSPVRPVAIGVPG